VMFLVLVTLISLVLAVIMSVIAWRVSHEEQRRSDARVAALAADIHDGGSSAGRRERAALAPDLPIRSAFEGPVTSALATDLFGAGAVHTSSKRLTTVATIGVVVFALAATMAVLLGRGTSHDRPAAGTAERAGLGQTAKPNPPAAIPLELVALGHERDGERLIVRGVIRNPAASGKIDGLTAVVFLFKADGGFAASGRAPISSATLVPGGESTFLVTVDGATDVARYRVSFRTDDRVVPHVDRRDHIQAKS
jgi:hypothetical protein